MEAHRRSAAPGRADTAAPGLRRGGVTVFLTGLPGAGKTTIARLLADALVAAGAPAVSLLDGDDLRRDLSPDLGFSPADRAQHIRRVGFVAREVTRHGGLAICAVVAPEEAIRAEIARDIARLGTFVLVHVSTPLAVCEARDPKGLYARARAGLIAAFTGVSAPYEPPVDADLTVDTTHDTPAASTARVVAWLRDHGHASR